MKRTVFLAASFVCAMYSLNAQAPANTGAPPAGARPPRYVDPTPYNPDDHAGWTSVFDGKTLNGWHGADGLWRVEDGSIVTSSTAANPNGPTYLLWGGGDVRDFEFKVEIKLEGEGGNTGVQFRAQMLGKTEKKNSEWESFGYQADYDYPNEQTGALIECCAGPRRGPSPRPFKASYGMIERALPDMGGKPTLVGTFGDPAEMKKSIHTGDWNQLHVIVRGTTMMYLLNGRLMSVFIDDDPTRFMDHGSLLIQLEGKGDIKVSFRNLWLKKLP